MSDTNSFIEKKVEEFEEKFVQEGGEDIWHVFFNEEEPMQMPPSKVKSFFRSALRDHAEYLKEKVEGMKKDTNDEIGMEDGRFGYNSALSDILALLDKGIKE